MKKAKAAKEQTPEEIVTQGVTEFLQKVGVDGSSKVVILEDTIEVTLDTQDSGIVIGYHGEVLEALQLLLSLIISKKLGKFMRVVLEVGDYRKNRIAFLHSLAEQTKERVIRDGKEATLPNLKSWERRIVHVALQDDDSVTSESVGQGRERMLVVKPR